MASKTNLSRMRQTAVVNYSLHADICCKGGLEAVKDGLESEVP